MPEKINSRNWISFTRKMSEFSHSGKTHPPMEKKKSAQAARKAAVLVLLYPEEDKIMFPVICRPKYEGVHSGQISLPGGRCEPFDENPEETALRETEEELGIPRKEVAILCGLSEFYIPPSNYRVFPFIAKIDKKIRWKPDQREVENILEINLDFILNKKNQNSEIYSYGKTQIRAPYFIFQDKKIWGATAFILTEMVALIDKL